ncbi:MAG: hypothetical protein NC191_08215 [Muribaculaceae bacterium]|nr:hypothetical protein [Muribaculaceae bacterium]
MGLSASQARLLTITARLTSNEYESQQVSNAKMRLAIQSQQASSDYIAALNSTQYMFTTYDAQGDAINTALTANVLYQYADMKNQYVLSNAAGQALLLSEDYKNYEKAANLDAFLENYGVTKVFRTKSMEENYNKLHNRETSDYPAIYDKWEELIIAARQKDDYEERYTSLEMKAETKDGVTTYIEEINTNNHYGPCSSEEAYKYVSYGAYIDYNVAEKRYKENYFESLNDESTPGIVQKKIYDDYVNAKQKLMDVATYQSWINSKAMEDAQNVEVTLNGETVKLSDAITEYYEILDGFTKEAEDLGCTTLEQTYTYSDEDKAKWYTNLWYRLNGESSEKNPTAKNYALLDNKLAASEGWIRDALKQGVISIEAASNEKAENILQNQIETLADDLKVNLRGITWTTKVQSSCNDITQTDNENAIAKAEAEYERKNNEISVKDLKYQNRIKTLDIEHTTLEKSYESVKAALDKNVSNSFKTFNS